VTPGDPFSARVASAPAERAKRRKLEPYSSLVVAASREWDSGTMAQWHNGTLEAARGLPSHTVTRQRGRLGLGLQ